MSKHSSKRSSSSKSVSILASKQVISREQYREDIETRDIVGRRFEKATQACIDIARMLLKDIDGRAPNSNPGSMQRLNEVDVLSAAVSEEMQQAALFRNVLAHEYGEVLNHDIVYSALQDLERYRQYLHEVRAYLERVDAI
ncbi:DUF86 domain-containing protein [Haloarchaeobius sp. HME9146]|uniref:type VII toxin-antitoxin system HepT family RNase toxin n=1 Tax=Haloarchaeobius sp. HME9146 TaxID=2978732 RepID=UPI0021BEDEF0|nr:DUF86 domain-containing protein [Haloarchaeobius sp. HME9146]